MAMRFSMVDTLKEAVARSSSMPSLEEGQNLWEAVTDDRTIFEESLKHEVTPLPPPPTSSRKGARPGRLRGILEDGMRSYTPSEAVGEAMKFIRQISQREKEEGKESSPGGNAGKSLVKDVKLTTDKLAAKIVHRWDNITQSEIRAFNQLKNMQITTEGNLQRQEEIMLRQLRNTLDSLLRESNSNTSKLSTLDDKYRELSTKLHELEMQMAHKNRFQVGNQEEMKKWNQEIEELEKETRRLKERYPIIQHIGRRTEAEIEEMRELLSAKTQVHKKLQEYMQDFMQMKRSLNQSCEVGGNQLHQINVKLEAHRKERETFLEFSKKQLDMNDQLRIYLQQRDDERTEILKETHTKSNLEAINHMKRQVLKKRAQFHMMHKKNSDAAPEVNIKYGSNIYTAAEILFAMSLINHDGGPRIRRPRELLNRINNLMADGNRLDQDIAERNIQLEIAREEVEVAEAKLKDIIKEYGSYDIILRREVVDDWHLKVLKASSQERQTLDMSLRVKKLLMQIALCVDSLVTKMKQSQASDESLVASLNYDPSIPTAKKIDILKSAIQRQLTFLLREKSPNMRCQEEMEKEIQKFIESAQVNNPVLRQLEDSNTRLIPTENNLRIDVADHDVVQLKGPESILAMKESYEVLEALPEPVKLFASNVQQLFAIKDKAMAKTMSQSHQVEQTYLAQERNRLKALSIKYLATMKNPAVNRSVKPKKKDSAVTKAINRRVTMG